MTDREKLIELLEEAIKESCLKIRCIDCNYYNAEPYPCRNELVADFLISHGVTVQKWCMGGGNCMATMMIAVVPISVQ